MASEIIIHEGNWQQFVQDPIVNGQQKLRGLIPRDYTKHPAGCYATGKTLAVEMPLIPRSEWDARITDKIAQKSQISDIRMAGNNGQPIPSLDQNGKGYCVPPGSLIRMADGSEQPIERVKLLDLVVSGEGNIRRVLQCHTREYSGEMVTVKAWGHGHLRATPNHRVMTQRGYVAVGELVSGDWIAAPRYATAGTTVVVQTAEHMVRNGVLLRSEKGSCWKDRESQPTPDFIGLTPGVGRIFGMWLAEGSMNSKRGDGIVWSFGTEKKGHLVEELVDLLQKEWGVDARVRPGPVPSVTNVHLDGRTWSRLFESLLGRRAEGKRLHPDITSGPLSFLEGLFWGWMDADGCLCETTRRKPFHRGCTVSHALALNMYDIANALGLQPTILREQAQVNKYAASRQDPWKLTVIPEKGTYRPNYRMREDGRVVWRLVRGVEREQYDGLVYNLGVEGDHSYTCETVWVSNCWAHSSTSAMMMARAVANQPYVALSAYAIACIIKNFQDQGGWGAESMDFITSRGVPSDKFWPMQSMDRANDNPNTWANAAQHKLQAGWIDLASAQYDRNLTFDQVGTLLLSDVPVVCDYNWWSHSVCGIDLVSGSGQRGTTRDPISGKLLSLQEHDRVWGMNDPVTAGYGVRILNSWGDSWSDHGMGVITSDKAVPDGSVAPRVITASPI